ncbi:tetratricopeptide repeat protein [Actinobacillus equuli]|uniref:tetratricopeptide repeat protein n=1 Tax=Actinobacillus equuli TaxID=718 RepID=UPI002441F4CC|nr:tetratricopeptide repeat protein [Actinobacillus equuli]WGE76196.1 tetratricopeptide repeat protein [Actinobacillus equuli subsp. haemolyticus]WGE77932.1 tetratricopeptide repeat protein [Actinobacillus equuli subsp. haemolyticus]
MNEIEQKFEEAKHFFYKGDLDKVVAILSTISREDGTEQYAKAQFLLGTTLGKQGKFDEAIEAYRNVTREDSAEQYAKAQLKLGVILYTQSKVNEAIEAYRNVAREDGAERYYATAQFLLGLIFENRDKLDEAKDAFNNIRLSDSIELYTKAQAYIKALNIGKKEIRRFLFKIHHCIDDILNLLRINNSSEVHIAHYTRPSTLFKLLPNEFSKDGKQNIFSRFRLSSINGVNDPTEGKILSQYLGINELEDSYITFISCFTFNHDSLNQFRLYGKENNKEVTGVSVVFDGSKFFEQSSKKSIALDYSSKLLKELNDLQEGIEKEKRLVDKLPLYRCIYIDPESGYLSLARREGITFYREDIKGQLEEYDSNLLDDTKKIIVLIENVKMTVSEILDNISTEIDTDEVHKIISEIILPLRYLVKHVAFKEEQECRMVYVSPLDNPKIILDTEYNQTYVEYAVPVKESIHRVYLSQGANIYKESFRILLGENKVKSSSNPFRNKD